MLSLVLLATLAFARQAAPAEDDAAGSPGAAAAEAERLVFLLQYVAGDYGAAVRDGRIVDEAEYEENKDFVSTIVERVGTLRAALRVETAAGIEHAVRKLEELVASRGDAGQVREVAESIIPVLIESFDLHAYPRRRPDPERARRLYAENCVPCHGERGDGDGPRARELDPPPARLSDPVRLDTTAPYAFYNAVTLGVDGTAMASFADSLTDQERWGLVFYLWTFRTPDEEARGERPPVTLSLRELAARSSADLAPEVVRQAAQRGETLTPAQAVTWVARLRVHPPVLSDAEERLARLRQDLARSIELLARGDVDGAVDRVTTAYLREFEPLEPAIDRRDARVRQSFERDLIEFRGALRRGDRERATRVARRLEKTVDEAAALLAESRSTLRAGWWAAAVALAALAAFGVLLLARGLGRRPPVD